MSDARQEHPSLVARDQLHTIANLWPELLAQLGKQGQRERGGGKRPKPGSKIPIDAHVSDVKAEVEDWVMFLTRLLLDETDWEPPRDISTPGLLRNIADWRIGHFTEHPDEMLRVAIVDDAHRLAKLVHGIANPSGVRKIPLHVACVEYDTDDQGARVECKGEYYTLLMPERDLRDMVCDKDEQHRMSPWEWQRGLRRGAIAPARERVEGLGA